MARKPEAGKVKIEEAKPSFFSRYFPQISIVLFIVLIYSNSLRNGYNMDDELVTNNHRLTSKGISAIPEIFTSSYYADDMGYAYEYRPLVLSSYAIEHSVFGEHPFVSHFFNLLFYLVACLLLYRTLALVFSDKAQPVILAITLLFAAHPAHTEVVSSIKNRDEILGLIFSLLALNTAFQSVLKQNLWYILLSGACFFLALISKVTFIPFFVIIPLAVILFTRASFARVLVLALIYAIPTFFVVDLGRFSYKLLLEVGLIGGVAIFYLLFRKETFTQVFSGFSLARPASTAPETGAFAGFDNLTVNLLPPASYFSLAMLTPLLLLAAYLPAVAWSNIYVMAGAQILLFLLAFGAPPKAAYWAKLALYICLTAGVADLYLNHHMVSKSVLHTLLMVILAYEIFWGNAWLRLPAAILYAGLVVAFLAGHVTFGIDYALGIPISLAVLKWRRGKHILIGLSVLMIIVFAGTLISQLLNHTLNFWTFNFLGPLLSVLFISIYRQKGTQYIAGAYVLILCLFVAPIFPRDHYQRVDIQQSMAQLDNGGKPLNVNIYKGKIERPLAFIEDPVRTNQNLSVRLGTSLHILFHYLYKVVLPYNMAFYYGYKFIEPESLNAPVPLFSLFCHLVLIGLAVYLTFKGNMAGFGIWLYLISIVVYSNLVMPVPGLLADRFLLVPSLGWCIVFVAGLLAVWKYLKPGTTEISWITAPGYIKGTFVFLLGTYSLLTFSRNFDWKDHLTLMSHDLNYVHESAQGNNLLALNTMKYSLTMQASPEQTALWNKALVHFKKSLEIYPKTFNVAYDIGRVYMMLNVPDSALRYFTLAERIDPAHKLPVLNTNIAQIYSQQGMNDSADVYFKKYMVARPDDIEGYNNLALSYFRQNKIQQSIAVSRLAQQNLPTNYRAPYNIAQAYIAINQRDSALYYLYLAQKLNTVNDPNVAQTINRITQAH